MMIPKHYDNNEPRINDEVHPKLIQETVSFWEKRYGRQVSLEEAREMIDNIVGFFKTLSEWDSSDGGSGSGQPRD